MKKTFETFRKIDDWDIRALTKENPSCFNGDVNVEKHRITIEEIKEPKEVIAARLQKLWDECDNHHHRGPLQYAAKKIGYEFKKKKEYN